MTTSLIRLYIQILLSSAFKHCLSFVLHCPISQLSFSVSSHILYAVSDPTTTLLFVSSFSSDCPCEVLPFQLSYLSTLSASSPSLGDFFFSVMLVLSSLSPGQLPAQTSCLTSYTCKAFWRNTLKQWSSALLFHPCPSSLILPRRHFFLLSLTHLTNAYISQLQLFQGHITTGAPL